MTITGTVLCLHCGVHRYKMQLFYCLSYKHMLQEVNYMHLERLRSENIPPPPTPISHSIKSSDPIVLRGYNYKSMNLIKPENGQHLYLFTAVLPIPFIVCANLLKICIECNVIFMS